jgi:endonuclease YncB( thermonuclease family)
MAIQRVSVIVGTAAAALALAIAPADAACPYHVDDGDTITVIATGEVIRARGFDTPETSYARCEAERRLGAMATARLQALLCAPGADVAIERGAAPELDRHKRTLAHVRVGGEDLAKLMVDEGWARPYNGSIKKGWCSRDSRDDLVPGPLPKREP